MNQHGYPVMFAGRDDVFSTHYIGSVVFFIPAPDPCFGGGVENHVHTPAGPYDDVQFADIPAYLPDVLGFQVTIVMPGQAGDPIAPQ